MCRWGDKGGDVKVLIKDSEEADNVENDKQNQQDLIFQENEVSRTTEISDLNSPW